MSKLFIVKLSYTDIDGFRQVKPEIPIEANDSVESMAMAIYMSVPVNSTKISISTSEWDPARPAPTYICDGWRAERLK